MNLAFTLLGYTCHIVWMNFEKAPYLAYIWNSIFIQIFIQNFHLVSNDKNYSKSNISCTLGLKSTNHSHKILFIQGFPFILKAYPNFLIMHSFLIYWIFNDEICSIFNFLTIGLNIMRPPWCIRAHQGFSNSTKNMVRGIGIWEISIPWETKQNTTQQKNFEFHRSIVSTFSLHWIMYNPKCKSKLQMQIKTNINATFAPPLLRHCV